MDFMELHQLKYFLAVAESRSFTRAAEKCQITQPSLSQQIARLEKSLGKPLFNRDGRTVSLTEAGDELLDPARRILALVAEAIERVQVSGEVTGKIRVGAIATIAPYLLPNVLKFFQQNQREAHISAHEDLTARVVDGVVNGNFDVGIVALPIVNDQLEVEALFDDELLVAVPNEHRLAKKKDVTIEDVGAEPFILLNETHCLGEHIVSFCRENKCPPIVACRSAQLLTVQEMVGLGYGISLIPQMAASADKGHSLVYRHLSDSPARTIAMIWNKSRYQSALVQAFLDTLRGHTPDSVASCSPAE